MAREVIREEVRTSDVVQPATTVAEDVETVAVDPYAERRGGARRVVQFVYLLFGIVAALLITRFALLALGANADASFAQFIDNVSDPLVAPFTGLFSTTQDGSSVFEPASLVALAVYAVAAWVIGRLLALVLGDSRRGVATSTRRVDTRI